ncbi:uncharacterized protein METZ01_LOCUS305390, partial [marine metagenome]
CRRNLRLWPDVMRWKPTTRLGVRPCPPASTIPAASASSSSPP